MNDPDFKPRELPPIPRSVRPLFVALAGVAVVAAVGLMIWAFVAAPHGVPVK